MDHLPVHLEMLKAILLWDAQISHRLLLGLLGGHGPSYIQHRLPLQDFLSFFPILLDLVLPEMALGTAQNEEVQQFSSFGSVSYTVKNEVWIPHHWCNI